jgi:hypothetical protein
MKGERRGNVSKGKAGSGKMESPDKLQRRFVKGKG